MIFVGEKKEEETLVDWKYGIPDVTVEDTGNVERRD